MKHEPPRRAPALVPLSGYAAYPESEMLARAAGFADDMHRRRTVRHFSGRAVPREIVATFIE